MVRPRVADEGGLSGFMIVLRSLDMATPHIGEACAVNEWLAYKPKES